MGARIVVVAVLVAAPPRRRLRVQRRKGSGGSGSGTAHCGCATHTNTHCVMMSLWQRAFQRRVAVAAVMTVPSVAIKAGDHISIYVLA